MAFAILIAMLSCSCNKFDIDWKGKKNKNEKNEFKPEEIRMNGNLHYKVYFSRNNSLAEKISVWEFGSDEVHLINLNRKGHRIYFTNDPDTFFTAILNNKGQVTEALQGIDYVFDEYNNLTGNSYTHQYEYFTASRSTSVLWRKIR